AEEDFLVGFRVLRDDVPVTHGHANLVERGRLRGCRARAEREQGCERGCRQSSLHGCLPCEACHLQLTGNCKREASRRRQRAEAQASGFFRPRTGALSPSVTLQECGSSCSRAACERGTRPHLWCLALRAASKRRM